MNSLHYAHVITMLFYLSRAKRGVCMLLRASAPGSLMLLGEYAVLHGQHALVCAIDKRMTVTLSPRDDKKILIESALGHYETTLSDLKLVSPFRFVLATLYFV